MARIIRHLETSGVHNPGPVVTDKIIPIEVKEFEKPKIKIDLSEYKPKIHAEIKLEGDITSIPSRIHYEDLK